MPQDSLRSIVYRSLVHCDDPNGVIEGETIRRSKTGSRKKGHRVERLSTGKDSSKQCSIYKQEKDKLFSEGSREELHSPPSFQLLQVSRGAHKLNQMIDSWSKGDSFDGQTKDIARDLLKGALDLQESLAMLCKLQEASKYKAQLKINQKQKFEQVNEMGLERNDFYQLKEKIYKKRVVSGRPSVDGSSKDCIEELRKVISESLLRQKLLQDEEKSSFSRRKSNFVSDIPSTSSSHSSMSHSYDSGSVDSSVSTVMLQGQSKEPKGRSLIAKLMGLEDFPSEGKKRSNEVRPVISIDMSSAKTACLTEQNEVSKRRTLEGIIETMQLKGLLKSNNIEEPRHRSDLSGDSYSKRGDEKPPIVLIRPLHFRYKEKEGVFLRQINWEDRALYPKEKLIEAEPSEESAGKMLVRRVGRDLEKVFHDKKALEYQEMKEIPTRRCEWVEQASNPQNIRRKQVKQNASANETKVCVPLGHRPHDKEMRKGKTEKILKILPNRRKQLRKENVKSISTSRSNAHVRTTSPEPKKARNGMTLAKKGIQQKESTTMKPFGVRSVSPISHSPVGRTKNSTTRKVKAVRKFMPMTTTTQNLENKNGDHKETKPTDEIGTVSTPIIAFIDDQLFTKEAAEAMKMDMEGQVEEQKSSRRQVLSEVSHAFSLIDAGQGDEQMDSLCQVPLQITQHGTGDDSFKELKQVGDEETTFQITAKTVRPLKRLLFSSPSFLSCAEDLFNLNTEQPLVFEISGTGDVNERLYLDIANELMKRKSQQTWFLDHPLLCNHCMENPRVSISLDQLVDEVCDGIDSLRSYTKASKDVLHVDSIYKVLECDLKGKGMVISDVWDLGWVNGFSVNEPDQVVREVANHLLSILIEEVIDDFSNLLVLQYYCAN